MGLQEIRYWLEDLELRKKLEENQSIAVIALLAVIIFCLVLVTCQLTGGGSGPSTSEVELVYFDLESQTIKIVEHQYPEQPSSPLTGTDNVFLTRVYSCKECPDGQVKDGMSLEDLKAEGMFIAWLEKIDPNMTDQMAMMGEGYSYRTVENDRWYTPADKSYAAINKRLFSECPRAWTCKP